LLSRSIYTSEIVNQNRPCTEHTNIPDDDDDDNNNNNNNNNNNVIKFQKHTKTETSEEKEKFTHTNTPRIPLRTHLQGDYISYTNPNTRD
jgi:hypothetical protein